MKKNHLQIFFAKDLFFSKLQSLFFVISFPKEIQVFFFLILQTSIKVNKGKEIFLIKKLCFIFSRGIKKVVY